MARIHRVSTNPEPAPSRRAAGQLENAVLRAVGEPLSPAEVREPWT